MRTLRALFAPVLIVGLLSVGGAPVSAVNTDRPCTILGTSGDDLLRGTPGADVLCGRGGNDIIFGGDGDDVLRGGPGDDQLNGEAGDDFLGGGSAGRDVLNGGSGDDVLRGFDGADTLNGESGRDDVRGGDGPDTADGGPGVDTVNGGAGDDDLTGGFGSDRLVGDSGEDRLDARDDRDFEDVVNCGPGAPDRARADAEDRVRTSCEQYPDNVAPSALALSNNTLADGRPAGTRVGVLSAVDPNVGDPLAFRLVDGAGSQDNEAFRLDDRRLLTREPTDAATKASYSIRARVTDSWGEQQTKVFTISVTQPSKPPVTPDVAPTAVDDAATVIEDANATAVDVLANDLNSDGGPLSVESVTQPTHGTVVKTASGLTYRPEKDYCNTSAPKDTFTYTVNGGSTATVSVTVTCVEDRSVASDDAATVLEDSLATDVDVLANDKAGDSGPPAIESVTQPGDGTVVLAGTGLTYQPDLDYCNDSSPKDAFTYTLVGGSTATVTMTVTCDDDAPTASDDAATVTEDANATAVDVLDNDLDADGGDKSIDSVTQPTHGTVVKSATALTYEPNKNYCNDGSPTDDFTYKVNGGATATVSMTVTCVDDPPKAVADSALMTEDALATPVDVLDNDTDIDAGPLTIESVTQPSHGTVVLSGNSLTYQPKKDYCNGVLAEDTFTYTLNGGSTATVSVRVTCTDDAPTAEDDAATVAEDALATDVDVLSNDSNDDGGPMSIESVTQPANGTAVITEDGAMLTYKPDLDYCNDGSPVDTFDYTINGGTSATVSMTVTCADDRPTAANDSATVDEDDTATTVDVLRNDSNGDGGPLSIDSVTQPVNGTVVITDDDAKLTYLPDANYCNDGSPADTFDYTVNGGSSATVSMTVTCVNDAPTAVDDSETTDEDTALNVLAPGVLTNDTDEDTGDTKTVVKLNDSASLTGSSVKGATVTISSDGAYTYDPGDVFQGLSNGESDTDSFTYTMTDGDGAESTATVSLTIDGVSEAPTANTDTFDAVGNTGLFVGVTRPSGKAGRALEGSVLDNDTDPDTDAADLVVQAVTAATTEGGTITMNADGTFSYQPQAGDTGVTDSFTYRVCDSTPCTASTVPSSTGTLNLVLAGQVWYVDNSAVAGGTGTSGAPFDTLTEADAAAGAGDTTFVFDGNDTSTGLGGGYTMASSERLIGEVAGLTLDPDGDGSLTTYDLYPATAGKRPVLTAAGTDVVALASKATVTGIGVEPSGGASGLSGGTGVDAATISDVTIGGTGTQPGLDLDGTTGTTNISNLSVITNGGTGVRLANAGSVLFASTGTVSIVSDGAAGLDVTGTTLSNSEFDSISVTGSSQGGVKLSNVVGPTKLGGLNLTTSGSTPAFAMSNAGSVSVPAAGSATVSAVGGPAIDVTDSANAALAFDSVSSTNSATDGINIAGLGTGTFSATGGAITGAQGIAFDLDGGSGAIDYAGRIGDGSGSSVEITGRRGGVVTLSGRTADSDDAGGGIALTGNTGATIAFTNTVELDTRAAAAFAATGGGTVTVTGSDNTLVTTSGTALEVANTTIGASGMTFRSISSNGASKGIVLDTTGTAGSLTVTGAGGTCTSGSTDGCSGGSIRRSVGADDTSSSPVGTGIVLKNTSSPSLTRMWLEGHSNYAIRGADVAGFTLNNSVIDGVNGTNGTTPVDDSAIKFVNLTGSAAITDTYVSGGREDNISVTNTTGTLDRLTLTRVTVGSNSDADGNDGLHLESRATAVGFKATIHDSTFAGARGDLVDYSHNGSGAGDLVITDSDFANNHPEIVTGGGGLTLSSSGTSGGASMDIRNNSFRDAVGTAVLVIKTIGPANQTGTFANNVIGATGDANSGSKEGSGLKLQSLGRGALNWAVTGNQILGYNDHGVEVLAGGGDTAQQGDINTTITGNTIAEPGTTAGKVDFAKNGIHLNIGTMLGDTFATCAVIGGAGSLANSISSSGKDGAEAGSGFDFQLRQRQSTTIRLPGYPHGNNENAKVEAFVAGQNGGAGGKAESSVPPGGGFTGSGSGCP